MRKLLSLTLILVSFNALAGVTQLSVPCTYEIKDGADSLYKTFRGNVHIDLNENGPVELSIRSFIFSDITIPPMKVLVRSYDFDHRKITGAVIKREKGIIWSKAIAILPTAVSLYFSREHVDRRASDYKPKGISTMSCDLREAIDLEEINDEIQERIARTPPSRRRLNRPTINVEEFSGHIEEELNRSRNQPAPRRR